MLSAARATASSPAASRLLLRPTALAAAASASASASASRAPPRSRPYHHRARRPAAPPPPPPPPPTAPGSGPPIVFAPARGAGTLGARRLSAGGGGGGGGGESLSEKAARALGANRRGDGAAAAAAASGSDSGGEGRGKRERYSEAPPPSASTSAGVAKADEERAAGRAAAAVSPGGGGPTKGTAEKESRGSAEEKESKGSAAENESRGSAAENESKGSASAEASGDSPGGGPGGSFSPPPLLKRDPAPPQQPFPPHPATGQHLHEFAPRIVVCGVGGAGGNAVNNMIARGLSGVDFLALNTDAQHLSTTLTDNRLQIGTSLTSGLGCGANPDAGRLAAEESRDHITDLLSDAHMVFVTAGMGGGTGTGAAPVVAEVCYNLGILTVGVVTKPFRFEGTHRMRLAEEGISRLTQVVDTLIVIPNQNLFYLATPQTSFVDSFGMADDVLLAGVRSITDLMTTPGLINLDFADVQSVMHGMGNAMLGTGQACDDDDDDAGDGSSDRAARAAEQAMTNPLLGDDFDVGSAKGMLVNITGGADMTLFEVDRAAQLITERVRDPDANIIFGSAYDEGLGGCVRVSVVATGIEPSEGGGGASKAEEGGGGAGQ